MNITKLLSIFILLFAANSYADTAAFGDVSTCGLAENSKIVDGTAITVCPQNIGEQIKNSFFGDDSRAFLRDSLTAEQASLKNDAQRFVDARNQSTFTIANKAIFSIVLLFSVGYGIWNIIKLTFSAASGDVAFGPGERYSILYNVMFTLLGIMLFVPIGNLSGFQKYAVIGLDNLGSAMNQIVIQSYAAQLERGNLETSQKDVDGSEISHPQTQYKAHSLTMSVLTHSLLIRQTSAKYNYFFNVSNTNDYELVTPISKIVKREGNRLLFEVENPEKPGQIIYSADPIVFNYLKNGGTAQNECLKAIGFDRKYSSRFDINNIENDIVELKNDIVQSCVTDTSKVQYQTFLNSLLSMYVTNLTTNWISTSTKDIYTNGRADRIAELAMNAMCADDESARMAARQYVATRKYGSADCVGSDWKVLGESKTAEEYRKEASSELIKINNEYYNALLKIQTALLKAFENADSLQRGKEIVQQGFFGAVQEMMTFRNDQNNASMFLSNFNDNSLGTFLTAKCADLCIDDKWLKAQSNYSEGEYSLNTQLFVKDIYNLTQWSDVAPQPTLDGGAMTQNLLIEQSGKSQQSEIYETSVFLSLENPRKVFDRCMNSALHPATCLAMYGSSLVSTGIHIKELAVAVKFLAAIQERVTSDSRKGHDAKEDEAAAKIGDKAKKQKASFISSFAGISQFASIISNGFDIFATLLITGGLINYVLLPSLMTFSFQALAILSQYYVLCLVLFSTTLLAIFVRPNDANNFKSIGINIGKLLGFVVCHKPIITLGFLFNLTLSDVFMKSFFPVIETLIGSIASLVGGDLMQSVVMVIIRFALSFFIIMITLYASLSLVFKALRFFDSNLFYLKHVMKATERFKGVSNLLGFMLPKVFTSLAGGVASGGSRIIFSSFKKRGD